VSPYIHPDCHKSYYLHENPLYTQATTPDSKHYSELYKFWLSDAGHINKGMLKSVSVIC